MTTTPAPPNQMYLRWVFALSSQGVAVEVAEFGLWAQRVHQPANPVDWDVDLAECSAKQVEKWNGAFGALKSLFSSSVALKNCDAYQIGPDGKVAHKGSAGASGDQAFVGTSTEGLPWECALCISTSSFSPNQFVTDARSRRGRFYLPPLGAGLLNGDGTVAGTPQGQISTAIGSFLNGVQGIELGGGGPITSDSDYVNLVVYSQFLAKQRRAVGVNTDLTHYRVGRVVDSQRRRRNKLTENYVDGNVSHA